MMSTSRRMVDGTLEGWPFPLRRGTPVRFNINTRTELLRRGPIRDSPEWLDLYQNSCATGGNADCRTRCGDGCGGIALGETARRLSRREMIGSLPPPLGSGNGTGRRLTFSFRGRRIYSIGC